MFVAVRFALFVRKLRSLFITPLLLMQLCVASQPVEVKVGVVFSVSASELFGMWPRELAVRMGGTEWNRMLLLHYSPFVVLNNTTNRPVTLKGNPTVTFSQPPAEFKFIRLAETMAGAITAQRVGADQMYVYPADRGRMSYSMVLYNQVSSNLGSGGVKLQAGQTLIMTPVFDGTVRLSDRFDWQNILTGNLKCVPGWSGCSNGFCIDWLAGGQTTQLNGAQSVIASRITDRWDVECGFSGSNGGWRFFKMMEGGGPVSAPDSACEITGFPFNLSDIRGAVSADSISVNMGQYAMTQPVCAMFSTLGLPSSATSLPVMSDSDSNGLSDVWEIQYFDRLGIAPESDPDGDGQDNRFEFVAGTSPTDAGARFEQNLMRQQGGGFLLSWSSVPGRSYDILQSTDLQSWVHMKTVSAAPSPATTTSVDLGRPDSIVKYFRIRMTVSP